MSKTIDNHEFYDDSVSYDIQDGFVICMTANHDVFALSKEDLLVLTEALDEE